jgi:hypothetical protein
VDGRPTEKISAKNGAASAAQDNKKLGFLKKEYMRQCFIIKFIIQNRHKKAKPISWTICKSIRELLNMP